MVYSGEVSGSDRAAERNIWRRFETSLADESDSIPKEVVLDALRVLGDAINDVVKDESPQAKDTMPWHLDMDLSPLCLDGIDRVIARERDVRSKNTQDEYVNALGEESDRRHGRVEDQE